MDEPNPIYSRRASQTQQQIQAALARLSMSHSRPTTPTQPTTPIRPTTPMRPTTPIPPSTPTLPAQPSTTSPTSSLPNHSAATTATSTLGKDVPNGDEQDGKGEEGRGGRISEYHRRKLEMLERAEERAARDEEREQRREAREVRALWVHAYNAYAQRPGVTRTEKAGREFARLMSGWDERTVGI